MIIEPVPQVLGRFMTMWDLFPNIVVPGALPTDHVTCGFPTDGDEFIDGDGPTLEREFISTHEHEPKLFGTSDGRRDCWWCYDRRPLYSPDFGDGVFSLVSIYMNIWGDFVDPLLENGLYYSVYHRETEYPLVGPYRTKAQALDAARAQVWNGYSRRLIRCLPILRRPDMAALETISRRSLNEDCELIDGKLVYSIAEMPKKVSGVSRRRLKLYNEAGGKCYYCRCRLDLRGKWEVDHKMPRALGGANDDINLVAACMPCNRTKGDRTDREFIARRKKESRGRAT